MKAVKLHSYTVPTLLFNFFFALLESLFYGTLLAKVWVAFGAPGLGYRGIILLYLSIPARIIQTRYMCLHALRHRFADIDHTVLLRRRTASVTSP